MENKTAVKGLMEFLKKSPSAFHAVENLRQMLLAESFTELPESRLHQTGTRQEDQADLP